MSDQKIWNDDGMSQLSTATSPLEPAAGQNVIVLQDLTTGTEAEVGRLKTQVSELAAEIGSLRHENQSLKAELREIKLVLSKVQLNELRGLEKANSWLRSLKMVV